MTDELNKAAEKVKQAFEAVPMATAEQVEELYQLIAKTKIPVDSLILWKKKAGVERFSEMSSEIIQKCIDFLKGRANDK